MTGWTDLPADLSNRSAVERLQQYLPDAPIVSSDLLRARQTAAAIAGDRAMLAPVRGLRELHFGAWEGLAHDQIPDQRLARRFWEEPGEIAPPNGESWMQLAARVSAAMEAMRRLGHHEVIVVCHLGPILTQLQRARGVPARTILAQQIEPLSVTRIGYGDTWQVGAVNHMP